MGHKGRPGRRSSVGNVFLCRTVRRRIVDILMTDRDVLFDLMHKINNLRLVIIEEHITSGEKCPDEMFSVFSKLTKLDLM